MTEAGAAGWEQALSEWLRPFLEALGHKARQRWAPVAALGAGGSAGRRWQRWAPVAALGAGVRARPAGSRRAQERAASRWRRGSRRRTATSCTTSSAARPGRHHFISSPAWQTAPLAAVLGRRARRAGPVAGRAGGGV